MGQTFLTHYPSPGVCGGQVVIDASTKAKLISPSFHINSSGLSRLTLDVKINGIDNKLNPIWECQKCGEVLDEHKLGACVKATCIVCSIDKFVNRLYVGSYIPCICEDCVNDVKKAAKGGDIASKIKNIMISHDLYQRQLKFVPLLIVLNKPIEI